MISTMKGSAPRRVSPASHGEDWVSHLGTRALERRFAAPILGAGLGLAMVATLDFGAAYTHGLNRAARAELDTMGRVLAAGAAPALERNDMAAARRAFGALRDLPRVRAARIMAANGDVLAAYRAERAEPSTDSNPAPMDFEATPPRAPDAGATPEPWSGVTTLDVPIHGTGRRADAILGTLTIQADTLGYGGVVGAVAIPAGLLVLLVVLGTLLLASHLGALATAPTRRLRRVMEAAARDGDYARRMPETGPDHTGGDTGGAAAALNNLLARVQADRADLLARQHRCEQATRAKGEFLANMSHELRTPLNAVIGFAEVLKSELLGPLGVERYRSYANDIFDSGHHLLSVINDILDLSKIEAGEFRLNEQLADPRDLIAQSVRLVRARAEAAHLSLAVKTCPDLPTLRLDPRLVKQALINLLSNAVKFSPTHGRVEICAGRADDGAVLISIRDEGIGIAAHDIDRVLRPFVQAEAGFALGREGTGLGLPLTKSFVEAHGGTMTIDSAIGLGTTVTLRLPAERAIDAAAHERKSRPQIASGGQ